MLYRSATAATRGTRSTWEQYAGDATFARLPRRIGLRDRHAPMSTHGSDWLIAYVPGVQIATPPDYIVGN